MTFVEVTDEQALLCSKWLERKFEERIGPPRRAWLCVACQRIRNTRGSLCPGCVLGVSVEVRAA